MKTQSTIMITRWTVFLVLLLPLLPGHYGAARAQGSMFVTGHNLDDSHLFYSAADQPVIERFFTVGLDFLVFGKKPSPEQVGRRATIRIAYLDPMDPAAIFDRHQFDFVSGYKNPTMFSLFNETWKKVLVPGAFDVVIVGCLKYGGIPPGSVQAATLLSAKGAFESYVNKGGKLFAITQYQEANFLPKFGSTGGINTNYPTNVYLTAEGRGIGMDTSFFNGSIGHYQVFRLNDADFKVFERSDLDIGGQKGMPVTFGFNGRINDSVFVPDSVNTVQRPQSDIPSGLFDDSVCVEFSTLTDSATFSYSLNGTPPASSPLTLNNHGRLCFRETTTILMIGKKPGWKNSAEVSFTYTRKTPPVPTTLALFSAGAELTQVTAKDSLLEVRVVRPDGGACAGCTVQVTPSGSLDAESLPLAAQGAYFRASFLRAESLAPVPGDGALQHKASDSVVLTWTNPLDAKDVVRRSYPYRPNGSVLALFAGGQEIMEVTFTDVQLEARLSRPAGMACAGCTVQVTPSGSLDSERLPLRPQGALFRATFARTESLVPVAGDGTLQHGPMDSVVLTWTNPSEAKDVVRRSYPYRPKPPVIPLAPALSLFYRGQEITVVDVSQKDLDIHLILDSTDACASCPVLVFPSTGSDTETVVLAGGTSPYQGAFKRDLKPRAIPGDGTIQHDRQDSIVLLYRHPLDPAKTVRRSYLFLPARDTVAIRPHNAIAQTAGGQSIAPGPQWIISDAPGLMIDKQAGDGSCCSLAATPVNAQNPDSLRLVGIVIEASHGFSLDLRVFSTFGEPVSRVVLTVPESEFPKLTQVAGKETRYMRLLWNGRTRAGSRAGNGAYVLRTSISLLPLAQSLGAPGRSNTERRIGILRSGN